MKSTAAVLLARCAYDDSALADLLERMAPHLGLNRDLHGKKVLLKPNLISSRGPVLACTDARFIAAVARMFVDRGAAVSLGDSPAFGSAAAVVRRLGLRPVLDALGVKVVEFASPETFLLAGKTRVRVAREALECDLFVNLPKIKAHNQMYMTIAVKNIFGVVKGMDKPLLHMRCRDSHQKFSRIILALLELLPAHITLADGIDVMHVSGPLHGKRLHVGCVAGSADPLAVDTAVLAALELAPEKSPLWSEAAARRDRGAMLAGIDFPFLRPEDFHGSGFIAPPVLNPVGFNPFRFLRGTLRRILLAIRQEVC
jgi:uncharacterized protein (DUF362 family)